MGVPLYRVLSVPTADCLLPAAYIISVGHALEPAVVLLALRLQRVNRNAAGHATVLGPAGVVIKKLSLVADLQDADGELLLQGVDLLPMQGHELLAQGVPFPLEPLEVVPDSL